MTPSPDETRRYDKLVRDDIPAIVQESGDRPVFHVADDEEYEARLAAKLLEEAEEFVEDGELEELADVLAVIDAIRGHRGVSREHVETIRREKRERRGGFEERIVLERVEPAGSLEE